MKRIYYVYILTNKHNTVLYTGMTNNVNRRVYEHKNRTYSGFSKKYNLNKLVYFERYDDLESAIRRENQIKAGSRKKKIELINSKNENWKDLSYFISGEFLLGRGRHGSR